MAEKLGVKIGTKEEVIWTSIKKACEQSIESMEKELIVQREFLKLANEKINQEKAKK